MLKPKKVRKLLRAIPMECSHFKPAKEYKENDTVYQRALFAEKNAREIEVDFGSFHESGGCRVYIAPSR